MQSIEAEVSAAFLRGFARGISAPRLRLVRGGLDAGFEARKLEAARAVIGGLPGGAEALEAIDRIAAALTARGT